MHLHSYPSIYNFGHAALDDLLNSEVFIEEKVDGSQFSFAKDEYGEVHFRSKGKHLVGDAPEKMFEKGVTAIRAIADRLTPGWTYRGEYLQKPRHNGLCYARVPNHHVILFDINTGEETYLSLEEKHAEAERIGMEFVPVLYRGVIQGLDHFQSLLDTTSVLGGQKIEGVVVKPAAYDVFGRDKKVVFAKFVSEEFREIQKKEWRKDNPVAKDVISVLAEGLRTPARWNKAVIHLAERGELENSPTDIGKLLKEVPADIQKEAEDEIKAALYK